MTDTVPTDQASRIAELTARRAASSARPRPGARGRTLSLRATVGITLLAVWGLATFTGVLLYLAPDVRRAGQQELLFGITKQAWGEIHWWVSVVAVAVTFVHLAIDWRTFRACVRHLTHRATCSAQPV